MTLSLPQQTIYYLNYKNYQYVIKNIHIKKKKDNNETSVS